MYAHDVKLSVDYDQDNDILYASVGVPVPAYCAEDKGGVLLFSSYNSNKFCGFTVMDFSKKTLRQINNAIPINLNLEGIKQIRKKVAR